MIKCITDTASVRLINCTTLEINYFDDLTVECDDILEIIWVIDQVSKGRALKHLVIVNEFTQFTVESKQLLSKENEKRKHKIISEAIVIRSLSNRILESYYIQQNKNFYPIKLFKNTLDAKKWLEHPDLEKEKTEYII